MHDRNPSTTPTATAPKLALFCQKCGHTSKLNDDWLLEEADGGYWIVCPDCETTVVSQPIFE
ncbi:MAG: hypothetical protein U5K28_07525 [Halobacteriales archaeon]|nr:hypothetical protein [Halobacteriales archaeon]